MYAASMRIRDARSLPATTQQDLREKAVKAVFSGRKQVEVAEIFGVTRQALGKWVQAYRQGGGKALRAKQRGRPRGGSLLPWQAAQIAKTVTDRCPDQLKLPFYLWTREAVAQLIEHKFGVELSLWTVGRYLARWGFSPQKPARRAFEQNREEVKRWLESHYPAIRMQAKRERAEIYWVDEMGLRSDHAAGRSHGRRGQTPVIAGTGKRFRCNMISALTNRGHLNFMVFKEEFCAQVFLRFLRRLLRQINRKVFLIVDRHPVHRSRELKRLLENNARRIRLFYLPGYSPELNPDEFLNQDVKSNSVGRRPPRGQHEMLRGLRGYLRSRQCQPHLVRQYFHPKQVRYAAV